MALPPIIQYDAHIISPGTDLTLTGVGTPNLTAQYGDYGTNYTTGKKADCTLSISYSNVSYTINNDNSITVTGRVTQFPGLVRTPTGLSAQGDQTIKAWFNGQLVLDEVTPTGQEGTFILSTPTGPFSVTIPPSNNPQPAFPAALEFYNAVTNTLNPDRFYFGLIITNPNPPDYRPGAIYDGSLWQSHNRSAGEAHIYTGSTWREMRTADGGTSSDNPPSIYTGTKWVNQRKLGKE